LKLLPEHFNQFIFDVFESSCSAKEDTSWPEVLVGGHGNGGEYFVTISAIVGYSLYGANKLL